MEDAEDLSLAQISVRSCQFLVSEDWRAVDILRYRLWSDRHVSAKERRETGCSGVKCFIRIDS